MSTAPKGEGWALNAGDQAGRVELALERGEARLRALSLASLPPLSDAGQDASPER